MQKQCKVCGSKNYYAKELCKKCYRKFLVPQGWSKKFSSCIKCGKTDSPHQGFGLCRKCYNTRESDIPCACGCGKTVSLVRGKPSKFRQGHWLKTQTETDEFWIKSRASIMGENNPCYGKFGKDHPAFGHHTSDKTRELRRKLATERLLKEKKSPTSIETILSNLLDELHINHHPQYPINGKFVVDEFIPDFNLIIEAFGGYWHGDSRRFPFEKLSNLQIRSMKRDKSKLKYLTTCGYKILVLWEKDLKERPDWCELEILNIIENQFIPSVQYSVLAKSLNCFLL